MNRVKARIACVATAGMCLAGLAAPSPSSSSAGTANVLTCFGQPATIVEHRDDVTVLGTSGPDVIVAPGGAPVRARGGDDLVCGAGNIWGGGGDDRVSVRGHPSGEPMLSLAVGGPGDDEIRRGAPFVDDVHLLVTIGGPGNDLLVGGAGPDSLRGGPGADRLDGRRAFDLVNGGPGPDVMVGGFFRDHLLGGPGPDRIRGGTGKDTASGGRGDDRILGQLGVDAAYGGLGSDVCRAETVVSCGD
jgi:Ca2+-binding RTX toxin-like protein